MHIKLKEITDLIESIAPLQTQESYDNSGLIVGNSNDQITGALISLDLTEEVIAEAIALNYNLIITHHPPVFKPLKKITGDDETERCLIKAIRNGIALYAAHTNLDNSSQGVNNILAEKIGIKPSGILQPIKSVVRKLVVFVPESHHEVVRKAIFDAGAGVIGKYDCCSFNTHGTGTFRAGEGTNPHVGEIGELHSEPEIRIETVFPAWIENKILEAVNKVHPYEEIAWDSYQLTNDYNLAGSGLIGEFSEPMSEFNLLTHLKQTLNIPFLKHTEFLNKPVKRVAVCGGSGNFLIKDAIAGKCDVFITGELKYHDFFTADGKILLIEAGHYETEQFTKELLYQILKQKFTTFALQISRLSSNPVKYF